MRTVKQRNGKKFFLNYNTCRAWRWIAIDSFFTAVNCKKWAALTLMCLLLQETIVLIFGLVLILVFEDYSSMTWRIWAFFFPQIKISNNEPSGFSGVGVQPGASSALLSKVLVSLLLNLPEKTRIIWLERSFWFQQRIPVAPSALCKSSILNLTSFFKLHIYFLTNYL